MIRAVMNGSRRFSKVQGLHGRCAGNSWALEERPRRGRGDQEEMGADVLIWGTVRQAAGLSTWKSAIRSQGFAGCVGCEEVAAGRVLDFIRGSVRQMVGLQARQPAKQQTGQSALQPRGRRNLRVGLNHVELSIRSALSGPL
jgi:hypothetical protein